MGRSDRLLSTSIGTQSRLRGSLQSRRSDLPRAPIIYSSFDEIQLRRNNYQHHLQNLAHSYQLANQKERAKAAEAVGSLQPFFLTYQGLNNRHLQQTYGEMICQLMASRYPQWSRLIELPALEINEKIRVGFVSGFFRRHSVWKTPLRGWVENLDRSKFVNSISKIIDPTL